MIIPVNGKYMFLRKLLKDFPVETVAGWAGVSVPSVNAKLRGETSWRLKECIRIKQGLGSTEPLEVLFKE